MLFVGFGVICMVLLRSSEFDFTPYILCKIFMSIFLHVCCLVVLNLELSQALAEL